MDQQKTKTSWIRKLLGDGLIREERTQRRKRSGRPKPQDPSGKVKTWKPPTKGTTPADRKKAS